MRHSGRSVERLLIPEIVARGFVQGPRCDPSSNDPYGPFRRKSERGIELVELHFDKNLRSQFRLNVGVATKPFVMPFGGRVVPPEEQSVSQTGNPFFILWRRGLIFRHWFGVPKLAKDGVSEAEFDAAVNPAIKLLPQIERLFETGKASRNMVRYPQGPLEGWGYVALCAITVLIPFSAMLWIVGWISRHL